MFLKFPCTQHKQETVAKALAVQIPPFQLRAGESGLVGEGKQQTFQGTPLTIPASSHQILKEKAEEHPVLGKIEEGEVEVSQEASSQSEPRRAAAVAARGWSTSGCPLHKPNGASRPRGVGMGSPPGLGLGSPRVGAGEERE